MARPADAAPAPAGASAGGGTPGGERAGPRTGWGVALPPGALLAAFSAVNLLLYNDRGAIASNAVMGEPRGATHPGAGIMGAFGLNNKQYALIHPFGFLIGLLVSSPVFSDALKRHSPFRILSVGLAVWSLAMLGSAAAPSFGLLVGSRLAVGVGEAAFVCIAPVFVEDHAPPGRRTMWLGIFYLFIPIGVAVGYIYGGVVGSALGWR